MSSGFTDIHCHILPGLDEGASTSEESLKMLELAIKDGISDIVATPHIVSGVYNNTKDIIDMAVQELKGLTTRIQVYAGAEIRISRDLARRVGNKELPLINNKHYLLLELPAYVIPPVPQLENIVRDLIQSDITPIFAHPERNMPILKDFSIMERLVKCGALFQITAMSVTGRSVSSSALKMIKKGFIHVVASDAHDTRNRPPILSPAYETVASKFGRTVADRLFISNPRKIIQGEKILEQSSL
jgi:protein-tyrosine phosphatase